VGPFAVYGEKLVEACIKNKCHYADITGESHWIDKMMAQYNEQAIANQVCLIPASGFDSVPSSLGAQEYLRLVAMDGRTPTSFGNYYCMRGGLNGGTLATWLQMSKEKIKPRPLVQSGVFKVPALGLTATEFVMAPVNERVVSFDCEATYHEHIIVPNRFIGHLVKATFSLIDLFIKTKLGRWVVKSLGPKSGQGPSKKIVADGYVKHTLIEDGVEDSPQLTFVWQGDPGNTVTVRCLIHTGIALACGEMNKFGFTTPAAGLGDSLLHRLIAADACALTYKPDWVQIYNAGEYHYDSDAAANTVTLITASNPNSVEMPEDVNSDANERLEAELKVRGLRYGSSYGCNKPGDLPEWREDGFAVYDLSVDEAYDLGAKWGQRAVVYYEGAKRLMLFCHARRAHSPQTGFLRD
jgi:short subunit dehydrogenase-like uncharacterized protein